MRIALLVFVMSVGVAVGSVRPEARDEAVIRARIYDYVGLAPEMLTDTQRVAADFYTPTGLTIDWAPTFRPQAGRIVTSNTEDCRISRFTF